MSRAGYSDSLDNWALIKWRGQVTSAIRGMRGQAFLRDLVDALEAMPTKRLIRNFLVANGEVCALGALGVKRGINLEAIDPEDYDAVAGAFGIAHQLAREIEYQNDEGGPWCAETPEQRWSRLHSWAKGHLKTAVHDSKESKDE